MAKVDEALIIQLIRSQSTQAKGFKLLMEQYRSAIYWHIRRLVVLHEDAQDILQDTFVNAFKYFDTFSEKSSLKTWLFTIATRECIRLFRKNKIEADSYDGNELLINRLESQHEIDGERVEVLFQKAILLLPEKQRLVFNLRYYDEMSYEEIALVTEQSVGTLKTNYHYAQKRIKEYMIQQD